MATRTVLDIALVAGIGALVGVGELISRYRDAPWLAIQRPSAIAYVLINALASLAAYGLLEAFDWRSGITNEDHLRWVRVLVAGFGAMALFRSSLFIVRVAGQDVGVGPSSLLAALLNVADRGVDRERGRARAREVGELMANIPFERARADLPALCLGLMQSTTLLEKEALAGAIRDIEAGDLDDDISSYLVGLELLNLGGIGVLRGAVELLGLPNETRPLHE